MNNADKIKHTNLRWKIRRRIINSYLSFSAVMTSYILIFGDDTQLNNTAITLFIGSSTYVLGAVWDDKSMESLNDTKI